MKTGKYIILQTLFYLLPATFCFSQNEYPADTVLTNDETTFAEKVFVAPISLWQRLSYNTKLIECQFYPSCSNYTAQAISKFGVVKGAVISADRIVRCNPFAYHYQLRDRASDRDLSTVFYLDGRLINPVPEFPLQTRNNGKSPLLASALSAVIPGSGRIYAGRVWDGLFGFITFSLTANVAYAHYRWENTGRFYLFAVGTTILYAGEIFGAYRSATLAPPENRDKSPIR